MENLILWVEGIHKSFGRCADYWCYLGKKQRSPQHRRFFRNRQAKYLGENQVLSWQLNSSGGE